MRVLLINPNFEPPQVFQKNDLRNTPSVPVNILSLATYLKRHGHDPVVIDRLVEPSMEFLVKEVQKADLVGISVMTAQVSEAVRIADSIKRQTGSKIVLGGIHATLFPESTCDDPSVDFVIYGEGEKTLIELIRAIEKGRAYSRIKGLVYKEKGKVIRNPARAPMDISDLPALDFSLIHVERYVSQRIMSGKIVRSLPIVSSRGCPHRCAFCFHVLGKDTFYRYKDPEETIKELKDLKDRYDIDNIQFCEDNLLANRKRVEKLLKLMIESKLGVSWKASCRANYFRKGHVDDDLLSLMKKAGCVSFSIGAEHGSQKMLDIMKKDITPAQILASARACNRWGFHVNYGFMFGVPGETRKDLKKTIVLIKRIRKACPKAFGGGGVFRPYPGGELYDISMEAGKIRKPERLRDWTKKKMISLMTTQSEIPWTKDAEYTKRINFYCNYYFFHDEKLASYRKVNLLLGSFFTIFVYGVRARFALNFFSLPIDKYIFERATRFFGYDF